MFEPTLTFVVPEVLPEKIYDFEIRTYRRTELAELYHPEVKGEKAWKRFRYELHLCRDLRSALREAGYDGKRRSFTPKEVWLIVQYLCVP